MALKKPSSTSRVRLTPTRWPDSLPRLNEDKIFSVVCGNTHIKWAVHEGAFMNFSPSCCWRTRLLTDDELADGSPTSVLSRHLPEAALHAIFGMKDGTMSKELALETSQARSAVLLTVYIVSTNTAQAESVAWCFSEIPCRVFSMRPDDFFSKAQGRYDTMGIDRLACMRAVGEMLGFPTLVIDGGTCMTYTACNQQGQLQGGGISLGVGAKFAAIAQNTQHAPGMAAIAQNHQDLIEQAKIMTAANQPLPRFGTTTMESVVASALTEVTLHCREIIQTYLEEIYVAGDPAVVVEEDSQVYEVNGQVMDRPSRNGKIPKIVLAGGDAELLHKLLQTENNKLVRPNPDIRPYEVTICKHLMAFGIANALKDKVAKHKSTPISEFDLLLLGCRVAKEFSQPDEDGDRVYRGTISAAVRNREGEQQRYIVLYDDVDTEELNLVEIHAALMLYSTAGEKLNRTPTESVAAKLVEKQQKAKSAAAVMEEKSPIVKENASINRARVTAAASMAPAASKLKPVPMATTPKAVAKAGTLKVAPTSQKRKAPSSAASSIKKATPIKKDPNSYTNKRIAKFFQGNVYFGTVTRYVAKAKYWAIDYDDGDEEEFEESEVKAHMKLYAEHKDSDPDLKRAAK